MGRLGPEVERRLRLGWFGSVNEIADLGLQRRKWLDRAVRNPHWSYVEFCESFPKPDQLKSAHEEGWLKETEYEILSELERAIDAYTSPGGKDYDHAAILADPAWRAVVAAAERAKQRLLMVVTDDDGRRILSEPMIG
jgi:hypothetical protein